MFKALIPLSETQIINCLPTECDAKCMLTQYDLTDYFPMIKLYQNLRH